jgi:tetratricopeptide (TPR) repeat protein
LEQNISCVLDELEEQKDFLEAVVQRLPGVLTDQEYRRLIVKTVRDRNREFLSCVKARIPFGGFCEVLRQVGFAKIADFLQLKQTFTDRLPLSDSSNPMEPPASRQLPEVTSAAAHSGLHITGATNVIYGSNNQIVVHHAAASKPSSLLNTRFNFIRPIVRELYGRDEELERALKLLRSEECPAIILEGIVGIGKTSLAKKICKVYLQEAQNSHPCALCFMVQFTDMSSPKMAYKEIAVNMYKEIVIQMFGDDGLSYEGYDERGYLNLLQSFSRQLPANSIVIMDDCENISSSKIMPKFSKALQKLMECSRSLKVIVVSAVDVASSLHDLPHEKFFLSTLTLEAAVHLLEKSGLEDLPSPQQLSEIAVQSYCHPLLLSMALQLLPILDVQGFLQEIGDHSSPSEAVEESEATMRLNHFFSRLREASPKEFAAFLEVAILPGRFFLDDWEPRGPDRQALQRRLLIVHTVEEETIYWSVPPVLRKVAKEERKKHPEIDRKAKQHFARYCVKVMKRLSSRLYTETRVMLRELDIQLANVQLLLNCVAEWEEDLKECRELFSDLLQSLTCPGIGNILFLRFNLCERDKTYSTLLRVALDVGTGPSGIDCTSLARVYLELCHTKRVTTGESHHQILKEAVQFAEKALKLSGGHHAPDGFKAECLAVKGRILASKPDTYEIAEKTLKTAQTLCEKMRADTDGTNPEDHLFYTELLSSVWKALGNLYSGKQETYEKALNHLQIAIELRSEVCGPDHISQVVLLMQSGQIQSKWAKAIGKAGGDKGDLAIGNLKRAIDICKDYGCQGHHLYGMTNLELGRTLADFEKFLQAIEALTEARTVFENLGSEYSVNLDKVCSLLEFCYQATGTRNA